MSQHSVSAVAALPPGTDAARVPVALGSRPPDGIATSPAERAAEPTPTTRDASVAAAVALSAESAESAEGPALTEAYARFQVDPKTRIVSISIINSTTNEVIRTIPPEEMIEWARMAQAQAERAERAATPTGRVVDRRV